MKKFFYLLILGCIAMVHAQDPVVTLTDASIEAGMHVTLHKDTTYILSGKVFVESGAVLTIQAGTVIKGASGTGENASALVICRGARIYANGTMYNPIVFTSIDDDLTNPIDLTNADKGKWGGVVVLGSAVTNEGEDEVEGIAPGDPRSKFGGQDDTDTSGILRYVSIRHCGAQIAPNNELNGLSLAGVGNGTIIEYVEAYASSDDGIEFWGGTVSPKYLVSSFCDDDAFDYDQGWRGKGQFWFSIQDSVAANMSCEWAGEWDGDDTPGAQPYAEPTLYNVTMIGGGPTANSKNGGILMRANAGGHVINSIMTNFKNARALVVQDNTDPAVEDSRKRFEAGNITFKNNLFYALGTATMLDSVLLWEQVSGSSKTKVAAPELAAALKQTWQNTYRDPQLKRIAYGNTALDPTLQTTSPAFENLAPYPANDPFFTPVAFKGAFGTHNWANFWTGLWDENILNDSIVLKPEVILGDKDIQAGQTYTMHKDTVYILSEKVFVEENAVLIIQPGTVIKAVGETGENAAALIICRGGKIIAEGTAAEPIIFTSIDDDVTNPFDLTNLDKGKWGGVVVLGSAVTNEGEDEVEGIAPGDPRSKFGGQDDTDSSGVLRYVSIRHCGAQIAPNNELNGLSLAGIGSRTVIEYLEVFASSDDGIEWWGGTVSPRYLISAFCDDDAFDYDQGWRGKGQFWFSIQDSVADNMSCEWAGEWDGDDTPGATPYAQPTLYNVTMIGGGSTANSKNGGILMRANAGGHVNNSILAYFKNARALVVQDNTDPAVEDSRKRFEAGQLAFHNNIFWGFGSSPTTTIDSILLWEQVTGSTKNKVAAPELADTLKKHINRYVNPVLAGISYSAGSGMLNPCPVVNGPAYDSLYPYPKDGYFATVNYKGAFGQSNWAEKWSFLSSGQYFDPKFTNDIVILPINKHVNPVVNMHIHANKLYLTYQIKNAAKTHISVFDLRGRNIATLVNDIHPVGMYKAQWDHSTAAQGFYIVKIRIGHQVFTQHFAVVR